jgi:hypothetical protein
MPAPASPSPERGGKWYWSHKPSLYCTDQSVYILKDIQSFSGCQKPKLSKAANQVLFRAISLILLHDFKVVRAIYKDLSWSVEFNRILTSEIEYNIVWQQETFAVKKI